MERLEQFCVQKKRKEKTIAAYHGYARIKKRMYMVTNLTKSHWTLPL